MIKITNCFKKAANEVAEELKTLRRNIMGDDFKTTDDIIKEKMELVCEVVDDYRKGELSDLTALIAVEIITQAKQPDPEAIKWAKKQYCCECDGGCNGC